MVRERIGPRVISLAGAAAFAISIGVLLPSQAASAQKTVSFQKQVFPILQDHCVMCHSPAGVGYISVGLDLRSYQGLRAGSAGGIAVIPFHPDRSPLMRVLDRDWKSTKHNSLRMPPLGPQLSKDDLNTISQWIKQGAKNN